MIPRILVPPGARMSAEDAASTRRRPSTLDERTLVPSTMPMTKLDATTTIPTNLPLESIATRMVVPRDIDVEAVQRHDESHLPPQPTDMDARITVPQGSNSEAELEMRPVSYISEELVEPDIIQTGEVSFLQPDRPSQKTLGEKVTTVLSVVFHVLLVLAIIFMPKHVRTPEEEEIARKQIIPLLPPGALEEALKPTPKPAVPHEAVRVDPRTIRKVSPPRAPDPTPVPTPMVEQPKRTLPSEPQPNVVPTPQPEKTPAPPSPGIIPKAPVQLEKPELPVPQKGLILPRQQSPGDTIRDVARGIKPNSPVPLGDVNPSRGGGRGSGTQGPGFGGVQILTDTQGVDFNDYIRRLLVIVKRNWESVMPPSVQLGDSGKVGLQFKILANGGVPDDDPHRVFGSGKEPLDRAAVSSIRASNPFPPLPPAFKGPYIELRIDYYYNLPLPTQ